MGRPDPRRTAIDVRIRALRHAPPLFAAVVLVLFWRLGAWGPLDPTEGRYAEIGREMLRTGLDRPISGRYESLGRAIPCTARGAGPNLDEVAEEAGVTSRIVLPIQVIQAVGESARSWSSLKSRFEATS